MAATARSTPSARSGRRSVVRTARFVGPVLPLCTACAACAASAACVPARKAPDDRPRSSASASAAASAAPPAPPAPAPASTVVDAWHRRPDRDEAPEPGDYVSTQPGAGRFPLVVAGKAAPLVVSGADFPGVARAAGDLAADVGAVSGTTPALSHDAEPQTDAVVFVGTIGKSPLIDGLIRAGRLDAADVRGRWEASVTTIVERPTPGIARALVIAGSDERGTIYGIYDLSSLIGVSPWRYWDDVTPRAAKALLVLPGRHVRGEPAVKYRGLFINDEAPALSTWVAHAFGPTPNPGFPNGFNHRFYEKVFEVALRLRANILWPAVWGKSFFEDDPECQALADRYGLVVGTSHEAPMMRAIEEWNRHGVRGGTYGGNGEFSFLRNAAAIEAYFADGIRRMDSWDSMVTLGMRGTGDTALEDDAGIPLMNRIVSSERDILARVTGKDPSRTPQIWTLYKEVQRYWDEGMRAPDDVTIDWCDDNWGNLRELPDPRAPERSGGYGIYYHFDYVGGGRNYKWVDTNSLANVWEQLHLAYAYGVDRFWMANVGDLKNEEHALQFFLDYAWSPARWPIERLPEWERRWAAQQFGPEPAAAIAGVLERYEQLQARRKPELLNRAITLDPAVDLRADPERAVVYRDASPFSLTHYREAETVTAEWGALADLARRVGETVPAPLRDAYYELVLYEVAATANLYALRLAEFENILYAAQGRASANAMADAAEARFRDDQAMSAHYNDALAGGKWRGFQTQAKIGYGGPYPNSSWQQPEDAGGHPLPDFIWPPLRRIDVPAGAALGVAIDGSDASWPGDPTPAVLPEMSPFQRQPAPYIEVFDRGREPFAFAIEPGADWITASPARGTVHGEVRAVLRVDWSRAPRGRRTVPVLVRGPHGQSVVVQAVVENPDGPPPPAGAFVESNGYVSIEAGDYVRAVSAREVSWLRIPGIGRTGDGMTPWPVTAARQAPGGDGPRLDYEAYLSSAGPVVVWVYLSPRNNVLHGDGLRYAVSLDDAAPQVVDVVGSLNAIPMNKSWERNTSDNVSLTSTTHAVAAPGEHVLHFWMVDPTVILQKIVIDTGGLQPSDLGPPESFRAGAAPPSAGAGHPR